MISGHYDASRSHSLSYFYMNNSNNKYNQDFKYKFAMIAEWQSFVIHDSFHALKTIEGFTSLPCMYLKLS